MDKFLASDSIARSMRDGSIAERFDWVCRRYAGRLAIHDLRKKVSYGELAASVGRVRAAVIAMAPPREPVAVLLPSDARSPAAALGVLTAGRAIVPLDADHPMERNRLIANHARVAAVVSAGPLANKARKLFGSDLKVIDVDALKEPPADFAAAAIGPDDLAWIIYTSGSTGTPKGVYQNHRGLMHDIAQSSESFGLSEDDRQAMFYSLAVIAGLRLVLGSLLTGGSLHILPPRRLGAARLASEIKRRRITVWRSSATLFRHVAGALKPGERLDDLRQVALGGDYVHWADFDAFRKCSGPGARFACHLGSTECSTVYAQWFVDEARRGDGALLPVGFAVSDRVVRLLDDDKRPIGDGETGEFTVTSPTLALGYWREPELTARSFSVDPNDRGLRTYRTGDLGRRRSDGLFEFAGRKDDQIKLQGFRIELGEIEGALRSCSGVRDAAVIVRRDARDTPRALAAYVQLHDGIEGLLPRHLKAMLDPRLPQHMIPADIFVLGELPWLANFKIDRRRLEEMDRARKRTKAKISDSMIAEVAAIFRSVLKVDRATPDDSLASLGGDSLQAVEIILRLERRMGVAVPQQAFRKSRSIRELADWIRARCDAKARPHGAKRAD